MERECYLERSQLRGYLFEVVISELLAKNGFIRIAPNSQEERVRENRPGFIELRGRGSWHQIDCPCEYKHAIPFSYPIRILGEVKFHKLPLSKKYIREYIGTVKDIQENYYAKEGTKLEDNYPRKLDVGVYFSASGFQEEAEKLAYAHGIKTVSYNNRLIYNIKRAIECLEENYLSVTCMKDGELGRFRSDFVRLISADAPRTDGYNSYYNDGYMHAIFEIRNALMSIKTSFIATTATGVFLHFVGEDEFPEEKFISTDEGSCKVYYRACKRTGY